MKLGRKLQFGLRGIKIARNIFQCCEINQASCDIAKKVSKKYDTIVAGGIVYTAVFKQTRLDNFLSFDISFACLRSEATL